MEKIRLGIIGMGNMGSGHFRNVMDGKCPSVVVTAVSDINPEKLNLPKQYPDVTCFTNTEEMLDSGLIDAALIAVPHYDHPTLAIECFKRGIHVLTEKPGKSYKVVHWVLPNALYGLLPTGIVHKHITTPAAGVQPGAEKAAVFY